jgi:putative ABC transport system permease protein
LLPDLKFAFRQLAKAPGFTVVAVLILALGIGANTAIFSVVNAVLLEPLPYRDSDRLVQVCEMPNPGTYLSIGSGGAFMDWQDQSTQLESIAAAHDVDENLTGFGAPVRVSGEEVSADYLRVFRVAPALGRDFLPEEDSPSGNHAVAIVSSELWQSHLQGDPSIVGKTIHLDGRSLTVIGVLPPHALFANTAGFLTPSFIRGAKWKQSRDYDYIVSVVGRLKPGATAAQGAEELTVVRRATKGLYPVFKQKWTVGMRSLHEEIFGDMRPYVLTLLGAVGVVLLIACTNIANLLLARATVRQPEIALRVALGASTGRIVRQLLTESVLLALAGGAVGLLVGVVSIKPLIAFAGIGELAGEAIGIHGRVLAFTLVASCAAGLVFGIVPALSAARPNVNDHLKEGLRGSTTGRRRRIQSLLLVSETALTVLLLVTTGLLLRSFVNASESEPGFNKENVLVFEYSVPNAKAPTTADRVRIGQRILDRIGQIAGVARVGIASSVPMNGGNNLGDLVSREDRPQTRNDFAAGFDGIAGDFFQALEIPLLRGRYFTRADDRETAPKVMIINDALATTLFGKEDPLGRLLHFKGSTWEIVGVVGSVRRYELDYGATPQLYFTQTYFPWRTCVVIRTLVPPETLGNQVRLAVRDVDPDLAIANMTTLEQSVANTLQVRRVMLVLLGIFAASALMLACVGIYGVIAYSVAQRRQEVGIRIALGAEAGQVIAMVLRQSITLVLVGLAVGLVASAAAGLLIADQLYGVSRVDPLVMATVSVALVVVALAASWLPARRAALVDPVVALRAE